MKDIITREEYITIIKENWGEPSFETCSSCGHDKICHYEYWSREASVDKKTHILNGSSACDVIGCKCKRFICQ